MSRALKFIVPFPLICLPLRGGEREEKSSVMLDFYRRNVWLPDGGKGRGECHLLHVHPSNARSVYTECSLSPGTRKQSTTHCTRRTKPLNSNPFNFLTQLRWTLNSVNDNVSVSCSVSQHIVGMYTFCHVQLHSMFWA